MTRIVIIYFHLGCGCSRTCIYLSAKWSCCTISFQGFKTVFLLIHCSEHCERADAWAGRGETSHTDGGRGRISVEMVPKWFSLDSHRHCKLCKSKVAEAETWGSLLGGL